MANQKENTEDNKSAPETAQKIITYTHTQLLEFGQSKASKELPKVFDFSGADEKRKEKLRNVLKNSNISQTFYQKNGIANGIVGSEDGVNVKTEQSRSKFQQLISDAVTKAQQRNAEYTAAPRRRIGSGRIVDSTRENSYPIGMDVRYMHNKLFKDDGKTVKNYWNYSKMATHHDADADENADAKSDEPEWANCGPISKHDIIELHGFDGPEDDGMQKSEGAPVSPPARSTPSKNGNGTQKSGKMDDHFNFEEFLKLEIPASVNCPRDAGAGESRFSQWFGYDKQQPHPPKFQNNHVHESKSTPQQFFDYHQKTNQKKTNAPNKFRSVDELEANWNPGNSDAKESNDAKQAAADNAIRTIIAQLAQSHRQTSNATAAHSNFFLNLMNKNANSYQQHLSQSALMERPDAQLLLHRLVNGEITELQILNQMLNPTQHQRDRETLAGVFKFCNENQQWLSQQRALNLKHKQQMSQQFRLLQLIQMKNPNMQSPLHATTQAFMQNAMYKKQLEDLQLLKTNQPPKFKFQPFKGPNHQSMPNQQNSRFNNRGHHY